MKLIFTWVERQVEKSNSRDSVIWLLSKLELVVNAHV